MPTYLDVFQRYEKKYILTRQQYSEILSLMQEQMTADQYGLYSISNIYLDTPDYQLVRNSMEKPLYKEKLRLRSYGTPQLEDEISFEIKKKFQGVVYKRRFQLPLREAMHFVRYRRPPSNHQQIADEISWCLSRYRPEPKVMIAYKRLAFIGKTNPDLRITFDHDIRYRRSVLDLSQGCWGKPLLPQEAVLMEIKTPVAIPLWLCRSLSDHAVYPASFSKYGYCYQNHLFPQKNEQGGACCA